MPTTTFSAVWTGFLNIVTGGTYNFSVVTDDAASLFIDNNTVASSTVNTTITGSIYLTPGLHTYREVFEQGGGVAASQQPSYSGPDTNNASVLITTTGALLTNLTVAGPGNLILGSSSALGLGTFTLGGGTVQASSALTGASAVANPLTFTGAFPVAFAGSNAITFTGNAALTAATTVLVANQTTLTGIVSGAFALTLTGNPVQMGSTVVTASGSLTLQGVNTYSGATVVSGGNLTLSGNGQNTTASASYTVNSGGTLTLDNNTNGTTTGNVTRLAGTDTLTLNGGTFSFIGNSTANTAQTFATVNLNSGESVISSNQPGTGTVMVMATAFNRTAGATVDFLGVTTDIGSPGNQFVTTATAAGNVSTTNTLAQTQLLVPYALVTGPGGTDFAQTVSGATIRRFTAYDTHHPGHQQRCPRRRLQTD